jgi:hypothetical protein
MLVKIQIHCINAAFEYDGEGFEMARILREYANSIEAKAKDGLQAEKVVLKDLNGNSCGVVELVMV